MSKTPEIMPLKEMYNTAANSLEELENTVYEKLDTAYDTYKSFVETLTVEEILNTSDSISITESVYNQLRYGELPEAVLRGLSQMENPLITIRDQWQKQQPALDESGMFITIQDLVDVDDGPCEEQQMG